VLLLLEYESWCVLVEVPAGNAFLLCVPGILNAQIAGFYAGPQDVPQSTFDHRTAPVNGFSWALCRILRFLPVLLWICT
jgi:hypothetical protein